VPLIKRAAMTTIRLWLLEARLRFTAFGRGLIALLLLAVVFAVLWKASLHLAAWDRWAITRVLARTSPILMSKDIVLVHMDKPQSLEDRGANHYEGRQAVAAFLTLLAGQDASRLPSAVVIDMAFRRKARDEAPPEPAPSDGAEPGREAGRGSGLDKIDAALKALHQRLGDKALFAVLDPFEKHGDRAYFNSSEPWRSRDHRFTGSDLRYGHTAFEVNSDCSLAGFWPAVNPQTHPTPSGVVAAGPTDDVEALAPLVAGRKLDRQRYAPLYFMIGDRSSVAANTFAFDKPGRRMHQFDGTKTSRLGAEAQVDWGGKTVIVGDALSDLLHTDEMSCSLLGIELLGWVVTDLRAPRPTFELLNAKTATAGWLLAVAGAIVAHVIVGRRTSHARHSFFYPLRTWLFGVLGGITVLALLGTAYAFFEGSIPGFLLPAAVVLAATATSTWFLHRIRTAVTDIFISYKRDAKTEPRGLVRWIDLSLRGITLPGRRRANVFLDVEKLQVTQHWKTEVRRRIGEAKIFVPILTREYVEQVSRSLATLQPDQSAEDIERLDPCGYELFYAMRRLDSGLRLFPVLLHDVKVPVEHDMLRQLGEHVGMKVEGGRFEFRDFHASIRKLVNEFSESDWVD
jgi:TIR domain